MAIVGGYHGGLEADGGDGDGRGGAGSGVVPMDGRKLVRQ